ncbi:MAG: 50S ribosomal protein L29 [Candidatus Omnitrophota bacterium]
MDAKETRALSEQELKEKIEGFSKQLMEMQFKRRTGVEKPHLFKQTRRDIARMRTVLREKKNEKAKN